MRHWWWFCFFVVLATLCALPRFGERENEYAPGVSDSDLYLEMAWVFSGQQDGFTTALVEWQPHHYNRPLLPWLAGYAAQFALNGHWRAAFSLLNILGAAAVALMLKRAIETHQPHWRYTWLPPILFCCGFPQLNWGYHILTDTAGYATALGTTLYAVSLIQRPRKGHAHALHLLALTGLSMLAFLTRETGWLAVITAGFVTACVWHNRGRGAGLRGTIVVVALLIGTIPHHCYEQLHDLSPPGFFWRNLVTWNPPYWLDTLVKTGVSFHLVWLLAGWRLLRCCQARTWPNPPAWMIGWTLGGLAYMGAAFLHNDINYAGFPLRTVYVLFPLLYYWVEEMFETGVVRWRPHLAAALFAIAYYAVSLTGVYLDPGVPLVTTPRLIECLLPG